MKRIIVFVLCMISLSACNILQGSGKVVSEERNVSGFNKVTLSGVGELDITQGSSEALTIEAEDNIIPKITANVNNGTLEISYDSKVWNILPSRAVKFHLTMNEINSLDTSGAGSISVSGLQTSALEISVSGGGNVSISDLSADTLNVTLNGVGNFDLAGSVTSQQVTLNGAGRYQAGDLQSQNAKIVVNGGCSATIWVTDTLDVKITGLGGVDYYGHPNVTPNITGAGKVSELGDHK